MIPVLGAMQPAVYVPVLRANLVRVPLLDYKQFHFTVTVQDALKSHVSQAPWNHASS